MIDSMKTVTIILPAYNEEASFDLMKERMQQVMKQNPGYNWEFLMVEDGVVQIELTLEPDTQPGYQCHDKPYQKHRPEI